MLRRLILLLAMVGPTVWAQATSANVAFTVGQLACGAVKRSTNTVQTYCFGPNNILVHNTLETLVDQAQGPLSGTAVTVVYSWEGDTVTWLFDLQTSVITYDIVGDINLHLSGSLTTVYGAVAVGPGCSALASDAPQFAWTTDTQTCTSVWSADLGTWQSCCSSK